MRSAKILDHKINESATLKTVTRKRYSAEFLAQAVALVGLGKPRSEVAADLEIGTRILEGCIRKGAQLGQISSGGLQASGEQSAADELPKLRREKNAHLKLENDILKKAASSSGPVPFWKPCDDPTRRAENGGSLSQAGAVLGEARSSFYPAAGPTATQVADAALGDLLEAVFRHQRRRYRYCRRAEDLAARGITSAPSRIRRLVVQRGLHAFPPKTFVPKISEDRAAKPSHPFALWPAPAGGARPRLGQEHPCKIGDGCALGAATVAGKSVGAMNGASVQTLGDQSANDSVQTC